MCSAVTSVWPCVRLFQVFGRFLVFGRVFGCYECLAVSSAVTIFGPCVQLLQALAMRSAVSSIGRFRFCYFLHVFICTLFYLFRALPIYFISRAFFFPRGTFILFRHVLSRTRIFSRSFFSSIFYFFRLSLCICFSFTFSACLFCFVLVVIFVFFCFACALVACFSLGTHLLCFVIVVVSAFCSMQCSLVPHHLSLIRFSVFCTVIFSFFTYY